MKSHENASGQGVTSTTDRSTNTTKGTRVMGDFHFTYLNQTVQDRKRLPASGWRIFAFMEATR